MGRSSAPVLIIGSERSGSNLLRLVLDSHSRVAVPHPPHFMRYLAPIAASYGDLRLERNRRALARDALLLSRRHIHPWPAVDVDEVVARSSPTLFGVVAAIYEQYRLVEGKARWGCKSTFMVDNVEDVLAEYPDARFVLLVREPRDVASSAKRAVFGFCHPRLMAQLWRVQQERGLAALDRYGPRTVHLLRYEDFVSEPEKEIRRLCEFVGESVEPAMFEHHRGVAAKRIARLSASWSNTAQPISTDRIGGHQRGLTRSELLQVDAVTREIKERLGYPVDPAAAAAEQPSPVALRARSALLRARVEYESLRHDRNWSRRWLRDATVRWLHVKAASRRVGAAWGG